MKQSKFSGAKSRKEIAEEYQISYPTFWRKIKSNNISLPNGLLTPRWQKMIYDVFGYPFGVFPSDYDGTEGKFRHDRH